MNLLNNSFTNYMLLDNYVWEWILAILITLTIYVFLVFLKKVAEKKLKTFAEKTSSNLDDY